MVESRTSPLQPQRSRDEIVTEKFNNISRILPELIAGKEILGMGNWGLVVGNETTATKIIVIPPDHIQHNQAFNAAEREVLLMTIFQENPMQGIQMPSILAPLTSIMENDHCIAHYTMTQLTGDSSKYLDDISPTEAKEKAFNSGILLAKFHRYAGQFDLPEAINPGTRLADKVYQVPELGDLINQKLANADRYLQTHMRSGVMHGDFHAGNMLWEGNEPCALLDFSFCGHTTNIHREFMALSDTYVRDIVAGYESYTGEAILPIVLATRLALWTEIMVAPTDSTDHPLARQWEVQAPDKIKVLLEEFEPIQNF